jgi:hypothetical protein
LICSIHHQERPHLSKYLSVFFAKYPSAIIGPEDFIVLPKIAPNEVDYEVELVIVIGKSGKNIPVEKALDHIVGWTVGSVSCIFSFPRMELLFSLCDPLYNCIFGSRT